MYRSIDHQKNDRAHMKSSTYYTLGQAAKESNVPKSTLSKALRDGTLSYIEKTTAGYKIDPSELFRVFPKQSKDTPKKRSGTHIETQETLIENSVLQAKLEASEQRYSDAEKTIEHLRKLLDEEKERGEKIIDEERKERHRLTALLTDQHNRQGKGFLKRLFG